MKTHKIAFWIATIIIFLMEGIVPILTTHSVATVQGIVGLGYPIYFVTLLAVFKLLGGLALIIPQVPGRIKEWAYAGYGIDFISAFVSIWVVMGFGGMLLLPLVAFILLAISYRSYHKMHPVMK